MAKRLISTSREPVFNKAGTLIGHLTHRDYVEEPDPTPAPVEQAPPVRTMTARELRRAIDAALVAGVQAPPDTMQEVLRMQQARGQR
jgi:hypothetical protein